MREILFRGRKRDGKWVQGSLMRRDDYCCILPPEGIMHPMKEPYLDPDLGTFDGYADPVEPSTIGQYTGLRDRNGKRIFEGDIIRTKKYGKSVCYPHPVANITVNTYDYDTFSVVYSPAVFRVERDSPPRAFNFVGNGADYEVIGNIHDNPELMGGAR